MNNARLLRVLNKAMKPKAAPAPLGAPAGYRGCLGRHVLGTIEGLRHMVGVGGLAGGSSGLSPR
jgi:hypothetical protein